MSCAASVTLSSQSGTASSTPAARPHMRPCRMLQHTACMLYACCISAALVLHVCCMYVVCMLYGCGMLGSIIQYHDTELGPTGPDLLGQCCTYGLYTCLQHMSTTHVYTHVHTLLMLLACACMHVACKWVAYVVHARCMYATCTLHVRCLCAACTLRVGCL